MAKLLTIAEVEDKISFKKTFIYDRIKKKEFPEPRKLGQSSRWDEETIDQWIKGEWQPPKLPTAA